MIKWWKRWSENHKGFSLVELIITVAIFSFVITGVGSAMVVSARSYQSGNVELDLQQQAQITANLLTNLIIDADQVVEASGSTLKVEKMESGVLVTYEVYLNGDQILYCKDSGSPQVLAENVSGFTVSNNSGSDNVDFTLQFTEGTRSYESDYHVTPRNGVTSGGAAMSGTIGIYAENKLILEPGQTYDLNVYVTGTSIQGFTIQNVSGCTDDTGTTVTVANTSTAQITVGTGETGTGTNAGFSFDVVSAADSTVYSHVEVLVRRVNTISVNGYMTGGTVNKAGAAYKVYANLAGTNLEKELGAWYDVDYVNPYTAEWSFDYSGTDDSGNAVSFADYFEVTGYGVEGNVPYVTIKLKQDLAKSPTLVVTCTALHPEGTCTGTVASGTSAGNQTNKTGTDYDTVQGTWELGYQAWRRDGTLDIGLSLDDSYFYANQVFMGTAELTIRGYSANGQQVDGVSSFNFFNTSDTGAYVTVQPGYGDVNTWAMILNTQKVSGEYMAYSSPYFTYVGSTYGWWSDVVRYDIEITYTVTDGEHAGETVTLTSSNSIEDVQIKFKNAVNADWSRTNKVYVTTADSINDYRVYFMFDKGWEGTEYRFSELERFVGVVHEDTDDTLDIRKDITPVEQASVDGNYYITFSISDTEKEECMTIAANDGGVIQEIYEYNPYFGKLSWWTEWDGSIAFNYPYDSISGQQLTGDDLAAITGCAGAVEFHFVDPNITGVTGLKVMYCPTQTEYGSTVYYIDDSTRFLIGTDQAQYQELSDGSWTTTVKLIWNGSGWTAN